MSETDGAPGAQPTGGGGGGGSASAVFAVLLSLVALAIVGYLLYRDHYSDPMASVLPTISALQESQARAQDEIRRDLESRLADPQQPLARQLATHDTRIAAVQQELGHLRGLIAVSDIDPRPWRLAEATHLLHLADHSLRIGADTQSALDALRTARSVLVELDDPTLAESIAGIDRDIDAISQSPRLDLDGAMVRLEAAKETLPDLPIRLPSYVAPDGPDVQEPDGWNLALDRLAALFEFRRRQSGESRPLLEPAEHRYLELNLALALERAQLALLRRDADLFEQTLLGLATAIDEFYDTSDDRVIALMREIDSLRALQVAAVALRISTRLAASTPAAIPAEPAPLELEVEDES